MGILDKAKEKIGMKAIEKVMAKTPGIEQLQQNVSMQFMDLEMQSDVTGKKLKVTIARRNVKEFKEFFDEIEQKYKHLEKIYDEQTGVKKNV